ncbi:uncharacterized protein BO72DRAFT_465418 [Aspergillus fijiensis CBS 313.89]|uniref:Berberine/berberine-like domain-containing protein n=1 Tax=Aspergillus fijiensis CBS 313.89 TaxID=1448319 RepID=A0A8G1W2I6_9EURO|nr:uncharacterized protein BO72DRAFT_465418 [Aspergillus fijiensis CBS 313.89]RAK81542.1 hypothetical protein BO72DRAFT_465418 [Aspergillus fijiensis CBS 313.89]
MLHLIFWSALCLTSPVVAGRCKNTPVDVTWPSDTDWSSLNASIGGRLLRTAPAAASCWPNSHFETPISCNTVQSQWTNALWLASQPDSTDCPIYANNSCCTTGGLPTYIVNATTETQIATAMKWAADRSIRIALPVLMDAGPAGACIMSTAETAVRFGFLVEATTGVVISQAFESFNSTPSAMEAFIRPVLTHIGHESTPNSGSSAVTITFSTSNVANYTSCISAISGTLLPAWRTAYLHFIANGATVDSVAAGSPKRALQDAARWYEAKERMRQLWAPESRAYMNEANPFDPEFKRDFYGANYDRLVQVKANNDPNESLFVPAGMGSD